MPVSATAPMPPGPLADSDYTLTVNGRAVNLFASRTCAMPWPFRIRTPEEAVRLGGPGPAQCGPSGNSRYTFGSFPVTGPSTVRVTCRHSLAQVAILPAAAGIVPQVDGQTLTFTLDRPLKLAIEPDGRHGALLLFADPPETEVPPAADPRVHYYGPGVHEAGVIELRDHETLYLAPGAVVRGGVHARGAKGVRILAGRGILCGDPWGWRAGPQKDLLIFEECEDLLIEGITIRCSWQWTIRPIACRGVTVRNAKICGGKNLNDDGIDPDSSQDVLIADCFIRTHDDCLSIKGHREDRMNCERITARNCLFWSDLSRIVMIGPESHCERIGDILIRDCEVLHLGPDPSEAGGWGPAQVFNLAAGEDTVMANIRFENVVVNVNATARELIRLSPSINRWQRRQTYGHIRDVAFVNVRFVGGPCRTSITIRGENERYTAEKIRFENCSLFGNPLTAQSPGVAIGDHVREIAFL